MFASAKIVAGPAFAVKGQGLKTIQFLGTMVPMASLEVKIN